MSDHSSDIAPSTHVAAIDRLPVELWGHVASFLVQHNEDNNGDVRSLSQVNSTLRAVSLPHLYRTVSFGTQIVVTVSEDDGEIDVDALDKLQRIVRDMLNELSRDQTRSKHIQTLRLCEYSWFAQSEFQLLTTVVKHCCHQLRDFQIALNSDTTQDTYIPHIEPFWQFLVDNCHQLSHLSGRGGPNVALQLSHTRLTQLDMSGYRFESQDDGPLPLTLRAIKLTFVTGLTPSLFRPQLFDSLEVLLMRAMDEEDVVQMTRIVREYTATTDRQSTLKSFSVSINATAPEWINSPLTLNSLLASFAPRTFPNLTTIEVLSTHADGFMLDRALTLCRNLPTCFPQAIDVTVLLGVNGTGLLSLRYATRSVSEFAQCFAPMVNLRYLTMNILDGLQPDDVEAATYFRAIPNLQHLSLRGSSTVGDQGGIGFSAINRRDQLSQRASSREPGDRDVEDTTHRDDELALERHEDEDLRVMEDGVRTLLGE
ncbi:hypothetical protein OIO90_005617 [Microbotryomycetes sp. JL221]|nr:hypothetical protein OIO90_005617 [Microbotryomycetes sp. JL221]